MDRNQQGFQPSTPKQTCTMAYCPVCGMHYARDTSCHGESLPTCPLQATHPDRQEILSLNNSKK